MPKHRESKHYKCDLCGLTFLLKGRIQHKYKTAHDHYTEVNLPNPEQLAAGPGASTRLTMSDSVTWSESNVTAEMRRKYDVPIRTLLRECQTSPIPALPTESRWNRNRRLYQRIFPEDRDIPFARIGTFSDTTDDAEVCGCRLWHMFKTVVLLEEQVRARNDPQFGALLDRVRNGLQTQQDLKLLNANVVGRPEITFHNGLRAITPLNRNRWALNMEAVVGWARFHKRDIGIFVSTHTWRNGTVSPNTIAQTIGQGDDSACKVPGVFFYAQGMPVVVNKNIYTALKVVNGAEFTAADIIPDPNYPGYYLADDVTIYFGPPSGILLQSEETKTFAIPSLPAGTVLIRPTSHTLDPTNSHFKFLPTRCTRRGLPVAPAFVLTDYKAQGKTFLEILLELRGTRMTNGEPSRCDFTSLYVQLSRCTTLQGVKFLSPVRPQDFIGNTLDRSMADGMRRLGKLAAETVQAYKRRHSE
ncbi:PIF1 protein [Purpureocillium lilacinum]|uniref:PIF1 protein n=1 Tax=Purpureocillium lilacinum TaxID=33203 RepID=A0A179EZC6_PURLI|nr:PIF1 protein [Purpureocillium lilacinum]OAQ58557.1 PIF1 protein [Purpureocillium lilacinum]